MVHIVIKSDLKWCIHLSRSLFFIFQAVTDRVVVQKHIIRITKPVVNHTLAQVDIENVVEQSHTL